MKKICLQRIPTNPSQGNRQPVPRVRVRSCQCQSAPCEVLSASQRVALTALAIFAEELLCCLERGRLHVALIACCSPGGTAGTRAAGESCCLLPSSPAIHSNEKGSDEKVHRITESQDHRMVGLLLVPGTIICLLGSPKPGSVAQ